MREIDRYPWRSREGNFYLVYQFKIVIRETVDFRKHSQCLLRLYFNKHSPFVYYNLLFLIHVHARLKIRSNRFVASFWISKLKKKRKTWNQKNFPGGKGTKIAVKVPAERSPISIACTKMVSWIMRKAGSWIHVSRSKILRIRLCSEYLTSQGSSSKLLLVPKESKDRFCISIGSSASTNSSQGRICRWWFILYMQIHIPL